MIKLDTYKVQLEQAKRCLTNNEFAALFGWSGSDLQKLYAGKRQATIRTIGRIAKALDVDVEDIITEE